MDRYFFLHLRLGQCGYWHRRVRRGKGPCFLSSPTSRAVPYLLPRLRTVFLKFKLFHSLCLIIVMVSVHEQLTTYKKEENDLIRPYFDDSRRRFDYGLRVLKLGSF